MVFEHGCVQGIHSLDIITEVMATGAGLPEHQRLRHCHRSHQFGGFADHHRLDRFGYQTRSQQRSDQAVVADIVASGLPLEL